MLARVPHSAALQTHVKDAAELDPSRAERWRHVVATAMMLNLVISRAAESAPAPATCGDCHVDEAAEFERSTHAEAIDCLDCHGGQRHYLVERADVERMRAILAPGGNDTRAVTFDHGDRFRGKPTRQDVPERCGTCHSKVSVMNPYGLPTDQWAQYKTSGHGQTLYQRNDDRVAVCTDCHGVHDIRDAHDPQSPVHPLNIPATCGRCHSDIRLMASFSLSARVVDEYTRSVHGEGLLEGGDVGMPHCATCHGSHSAVPPGFHDVGHVCGRCHRQVEEQFLRSHHAKFPMFPRCVGCHTERVDQRDHHIVRVVASPESIRSTFERVTRSMPDTSVDDPDFIRVYSQRRDPPIAQFETVCQRCHNPQRVAGHRFLFGNLDERARQLGEQLYGMIRESEIRFAQTAIRVDEIGQGVLLVTDEALLTDEMRTHLVSLGPLQHTLSLEVVGEKRQELETLAAQINQSLDDKVRHLQWRYWALIPLWVFVLVFVSALWLKYKQLKSEWVVPVRDSD